MKSHQLRTLRVIIAGLIFVSFFVIFADFRSLIPSQHKEILIYLQFIPSALKFHNIATFAAAGFAFILLLTFITGRTYCSFLCPLGISQDITSRIGGKFRKKFRRYGYKKPHTVLRYSILAITLVVTMIWGIYMLTLLDPYSIFGRFMTFFGKPAVIGINNLLSNVLGKFDVYSVSHVPVKPFELIVYSLPLIFFLLVGTFSFTKGRFYCNTVCPVGTFLGMISKVSILRINHDDSACTRCGRCAMRCKSSCIDFLNHKIDVTRCVECFNCINVCPDNAMSYGFVKLKKKQQEVAKTDNGRRKVIVSSIFLLLGINKTIRAQEPSTPKPKKQSTVKEEKTYPVCPPGSVSINDFNKKCTACSLCINACPNNVLQPAFKEYGFAGMMQPVMNYHKSFCTYKCNICTEVCPSNALQPLMLEAKQLTQIGKVKFIKDNCVVKTEKTSCGACSESCPTKAVDMIPYEGNLLIPQVNDEICVGCGHCEYACPVTPYKAIYVDGNPVHLTAKKPENQKAEIETPQEFPF
jgi:ferredoxin-type protein NapF